MSDLIRTSAPTVIDNTDAIRVAFNANTNLCRLNVLLGVTSADHNAVLTNNADFVLMTGGTYTIKLPASPVTGSLYYFLRQTTTGTLTIDANGSVFNAGGSTFTLGAAIGDYERVVWSGDATMGWWL